MAVRPCAYPQAPAQGTSDVHAPVMGEKCSLTNHAEVNQFIPQAHLLPCVINLCLLDPQNILLYTVADDGQVAFYCTDTGADNTDRYLVAWSLRPVAVHYNPTTQVGPLW